jgi:hypothetical protein
VAGPEDPPYGESPLRHDLRPARYFGAVGQQRLADEGVDWPRIDFINYARTMTSEARTIRGQFDPGDVTLLLRERDGELHS